MDVGEEGDSCWLLLKCCFTSTETVGLLGTSTSTFTQLLSPEFFSW